MVDSDTKLRPILVTGSSGYIGRYLTQYLKDCGDQVVGLCRKDCDITDVEKLQKIVEQIYPRAIYHLAGITGVEESWKNPNEFYRVNVLGVQRVLEACRTVDARLIFISAYLYDGGAPTPVDEGSRINPMNPYAHTKWLGENICRFFYDHYNVRCIIARPFNVYGGQQSNRFIIPKLIEQVVSDSQSVTVKDSAPIRDYVYIKDLVSVLRKFHDCNLEFETFNVGTGIGHSVQDVNDIIQSVWGVKKVLVNLNLPRDNEISVSVANINKISSELGWKPSYSLHDGLREMYESDC